MTISEEQIKKIAKLARISLKPEEVKPLAEQVGSIINWVEQLSTVNTVNIKEIHNINNINITTRKDQVLLNNESVSGDNTKKIFNYFAVPKVLE